MDCLSCGNCKDNQLAYYCLAKNEVIINDKTSPTEKSRSGWKKGSIQYEKHRRQSRKEIEA